MNVSYEKKMIPAAAITVIFGLIFWRQSPALGISMGLCMGAAFGLFAGGRAEKDVKLEASEKKNENYDE